MSGTYWDEGGLDPRGAASLLVQTQRQAQRGLDFRSPWLSVLAAAGDVGRLRCGVAVGPRTASLQGPDRGVAGWPVCRRS